MAEKEQRSNLTQWTELLQQRQEHQLLTLLQEAPSIEIAEFLAPQPHPQLLALLTRLPQELQGAIFADFDPELCRKFLNRKGSL